MRLSVIALVLCASALLAGPALAQSKPSQKFITEAIESNYAEVAMGELAQKNAQTAAVKSFGQRLITDHRQANQKAVLAAQQIGITSPPSGPNKKQQADHDKMSKLTGVSFDKAFAQHMVRDQKKEIATYSQAAKTNDAAGQYAREILPFLQKHLKESQALTNPKAAAR